MARSERWLCALSLAATLAACQTDHDALSKKPNSGQGGSTGSGSAGSPAVLGGSGGDVASGGGHSDDEPPGKSVLTVVNGVVDAPSLVWCFAKVDAQGGVSAFGQPLTDQPFEYGKSISLSAVDGAHLDTDTLAPLVIAGELDLISGLGCEDAVARAEDEEAAAVTANAQASEAAQAGAGGAGDEGSAPGEAGAGGAPSYEIRSRLRLRTLPAIPAGTLTAGYDVLLVGTGCLGGATYQATHAEEYCGEGYTERTPTVSALLVPLSRLTDAVHVGLQVVHASLASPTLSVSSGPPFPSTAGAVQIVSSVGYGQAAPRTAQLSNTVSDLGISHLFQVQVAAQGSVLGSYDWTDMLSSSGLKALTNGSNYSLVLVGPRPDHTSATPLWNASQITLVPVTNP